MKKRDYKKKAEKIKDHLEKHPGDKRSKYYLKKLKEVEHQDS